MSWKSTWVLLALAGALATLSIFVEHPWRTEQARLASRSALPGLKPEQVTNVNLTLWGQRMIQAERPAPGSHEWRLLEPVAYPADWRRIEDLLEALAQLQWQDRIGARELLKRPDAENSYGFAQPQCTLELQGRDGARHLEIGNITALGDQLFVKVVGSYDIYKVSVALTNEIPRNKDIWRDTAVVNLKEISFQGIQVKSQEKSFDLARDKDTGLWEMTKPVQARADSARIEQLLKRLGGLRVGAFVNDEAPSLLEQCGLQTPPQTPQLELSLLNGSNVVFGLQMGSNYAAIAGSAFARRANPSNIVLVPSAGLLPWEADSTSFLDRHIFSLPASNIEEMEVAGEDVFSARRRGDGGWEVEATGKKFPADEFFMNQWMGELTNVDLEIEKMVVAEADLASYGLAKPQMVYKALGTQRGSNQLLAQIEFGSNTANGTFERRVDESSVNMMPAGEFGRLPRVSWQLRDRRLWEFNDSNVVSVAIHYLGGDRKYLRDPAGEWTFAPGYHGPPFPDWARLEEGLHRMGELRAIYWDGIGEDPTDQFGIGAADHRVTLEVKTGERSQTYEVEFGKRSPYLHPYAAVVKGGQRLIFEFPADLFDGFIAPEFTLPAALRQSH